MAWIHTCQSSNASPIHTHTHSHTTPSFNSIMVWIGPLFTPVFHRAPSLLLDMLSICLADTCRSAWKESLLWSWTCNILRRTRAPCDPNVRTPSVFKYLCTANHQSRERRQRLKLQQTRFNCSYFQLKLIIVQMKLCNRMPATDGGGVFRRLFKK